MAKKNDKPKSVKKATDKKPQHKTREEELELSRKALRFFFMSDGLKGSPFLCKIAMSRQDRHDLIGISSLDEDFKDRLRQVRGKAKVSLSGDDLSKICFTLWDVMVDLNNSQRGQWADLAANVTDWAMQGLNEVVSQHANSMLAGLCLEEYLTLRRAKPTTSFLYFPCQN